MFVRLLGGSPTIKVLDFLFTSRDFDYSKKCIAENSNVSWNTLASIWRWLSDSGVVIKTRRVGKQDLFKANRDSPLVKILMKTYDELIMHSIDEVAKEIAAPENMQIYNATPALKKALDIAEIKRRSAPILKKFGVEKAALFGSFARREAKEDSDIDMLVELPEGTSLLVFAGLKLELELALDRKIDLVSYGWIDEHIKGQIMRERVVLYE